MNRYPWLHEYLLQRPGATTYYKPEWEWQRYQVGGHMFAATCWPGPEHTTAENRELISLKCEPLRGPAYIARVSTHDVKHVIEAKKAIKKAFETQIAGKGFSMVEVLSTCPTNWGMTPLEALKWLETNMIPQYPLGVFKEVE